MFSMLSSVLIALSLFASSSLAIPAAPPFAGGGVPFYAGTSQSVSLDYKLNQANIPINELTCSNSLAAKRFKGTLGSVPSFPFVAAASEIPEIGGNEVSSACGKCYQIGYEDRSVYVLVVDGAGSGVGLGPRAMDQLAAARGEPVYKLDATVIRVDDSHCGL